METGIKHRNYNIKGASYQNSSGKWIPQALFSPEERPEEGKPLTWQKEFKDKRKADDFAVQGTILYIDENL